MTQSLSLENVQLFFRYHRSGGARDFRDSRERAELLVQMRRERFLSIRPAHSDAIVFSFFLLDLCKPKIYMLDVSKFRKDHISGNCEKAAPQEVLI